MLDHHHNNNKNNTLHCLPIFQYNLLHGSFLLMNIIGFMWYFSICPDYHHFIKYLSLQGFEIALLYSFLSFLPLTR